MLFKRFLFIACILLLAGVIFQLLSDSKFEIESGDTYYVINASYLFIAAGISIFAPGIILLYIELIVKKSPPKKLTKISFTLHLGGLLILLTTMLFPFSEHKEWIGAIKVFVYIGLFLTVAGMSILPAILMISLRKRRGN